MTAAADAPSTPIERNEELRIALVMNGGVSLAVWMGGVSFELNRLIGETHPVYRGLLELTQTRALIDVISGTSAGGINGAALALACVYDTTLWPLRDLWLDKGAFDSLLRDTSESEPASLLDGDGVFLPSIKEGFNKLIRPKPLAADTAPMDLTLTATMLRGESQARLDELGERIEDANHRAQFHFERQYARARTATTDEHPDPFASEGIVQVLAQAARASASFPVAFEPWFVDAKSEHCESLHGSHTRPLRHARYLIDGGVLDNKPIEGTLRAIFKRPPRGNVRRVLVYVTPDPAASAADSDDTIDDPPTIIEVALSSLITIAGAESIADQLERIADHNESVRTRRDAIASMVSKAGPTELDAIAEYLFEMYRDRRVKGLLDYVVQEVERGLASQLNAGTAPVLGHRTREWLKAVWRSSPDAPRYWEARIPTVDDRYDFRFAPSPAGWTWGVYPLEFALRLTLELLRRTQRLRHITRPSGSPRTSADVTCTKGATDRWEELDRQLRERRSTVSVGSVLADDPELSPLWERAFSAQEDLGRERATAGARFAEHAEDLAAALNAVPSDLDTQEGQVRDWLFQRLVENPDETGASAGQRFADRKVRNADTACRIAEILLDLRETVAALITGNRRLREDERVARDELSSLYRFLYRDDQGTERPRACEELMRRVLKLEVIVYSLVGRRTEPGTLVELVQLSAKGASPWGGAIDPGEKLAGMQLAHFGAFYRRSWRANDWMVGRLDGIDRLIRIVLNPDRLHRLYGGIPSAIDDLLAALHRLSVGSAEDDQRRLLEGHWRDDATQIRNELAFLERTDARVPETLPRAASALVRRLHLEVISRELVDVARAAKDDALDGTRVDGPSARLAQHVTSDRLVADEAIRLYTSDAYRVGSERLEDEAGGDALTRTATRTMVVAHAALSGRHSGLSLAAKILKPLRLPLQMLSLAADRLMDDSRTSAAFTATMLVCGVLFVLGPALLDKPSSALSALGWSLLFGWTATALLRGQLRHGFAAVLILLVLVLAEGPAKVIAPLVFLTGLVMLFGVSTWLGALLLSLVILWWSTGGPSCPDMMAALAIGSFETFVTGLADVFPGDACSVSIGNAENGMLMRQLMLPLMVVVALALLGRLADQRRKPGRQSEDRR